MSVDLKQLRAALGGEEGADLSTPVWQSYLTYYQLQHLDEHYQHRVYSVSDLTATNVVHHYYQPASSQGTAVVVHGYMDHTGLYNHLIEYLLQQGWDVLIYDQQGHGLSSGERYAIDSFSQYVAELQKVLNVSAPKLRGPLVLIGQSTGGATVLGYCLSTVQRPALEIVQSIVLAPLIRSKGFFKVRLLYALLQGFIHQTKRAPSQSSHDIAFLKFLNTQDPLRHHFIKLNWLGAMIDWQRYCQGQAGNNGELMVIQGDDDQTVDWRYNLKEIARIFPKAELFPVPGGKHHLVNEELHWRNQVFEKIGFCLARL